MDPETNEINLKCLDEMVNHFNAMILSAICCNMDLKFIGSGKSAKAILYYITDHILKAQLKAHVAYAALELAVWKLGEYNPLDDEPMVQAKHLLQKCAHAMISHQELSSQQVMSYLLDFEDHFTSHQFNCLFWTTFETSIESEDPSPECYNRKLVDDKFQTKLKVANDPDEDVDNRSEEPSGVAASELSNEDLPAEDDIVNHDEVTISVDTNDQFMACPSQLTNYKHRAQELDNLCLWDFCVQTEKIKMAHWSPQENPETLNVIDINVILDYSTKKRPSYGLIAPHDQCNTHTLRCG